MYIFEYIYIYIYIGVVSYIYRYIHMYLHIHIHIYVYIFEYMYMYIYCFCRGINFECIYKNGSLRIIITDIWHCFYTYTHATLYSMRRLVVPLEGS